MLDADFAEMEARATTDDQLNRLRLLRLFAGELATLAHHALYVCDFERHEIVMLCIEMNKKWRRTAEALAPGQDWTAFEVGQETVVRGSAPFALCEVYAERFPRFAEALSAIPGEGYIKCIVTDADGILICNLKPMAETLN